MMSKAKMFNEKAAQAENKPDEILNIMDIKDGQSIADIGSGGGYFTLRFAKLVGEQGKVYAVDVNQEFLNFIKISASKEGLTNVKTTDKLDISENSLDFIFMRNMTHHLKYREQYFLNLKPFLKAAGKFIVIDYEKGKTSFLKAPIGHNLKKEVIKQEMRKSGYHLDKDIDILPSQFFLIFSKTTS